MFHVGQKVVCVDASPGRHSSKYKLALGQIYTVRGIDPESPDSVYLAEIPSEPIPPGYTTPRGWWYLRFRPIQERKTDISIFTAMLTPKKVRVEA